MTFQSACLALGQLLVLISAWMLYRTSNRFERIFNEMRSLIADAKNQSTVSPDDIRAGSITSRSDKECTGGPDLG
ncbi:hypothetical protein [Burkholderia gladioli]|uniref:hypothetical protein n=1 Tax=Burkholderia gladioli TaxID=28095 RepID=UPI00164080F9|nr:hypothetical protein [Burkholderia gladioli]